MKSLKNKNSTGFTLIELLVVISILGLLSSLVLVSLQGARDQADLSKAQEFSHAVRVALGTDLIGEWRFEDGVGINATDSSGNNNNGTLQSFGFSAGSDWTDEGIFNKALEFDGDNDRVALPVLFENSGVCDLTIAAWSYNVGMDPAGLMGGVVAGTSNGWANIEYRDNGLRFELRNAAGGNSFYISDDYADRWLYTVLILDNGQPYAYINGELVWSTSGNIGCIGLTNWSIGDWDRNFHGIIDEVQVYNKALSSAEIQQLFAQKAAEYKIGYEY